MQRDAAMRHNDSLPVARLPPEILAEIFTLLSSIDKAASWREKDKIKTYLGWLSVTHVCQIWRDVALLKPALWASNITVPYALGERWANTFLTRSKTALLTIMPPPHSDPLRVFPLYFTEIDVLRNNLARTCSLRISTSAFVPALYGPAPSMEAFVFDPVDSAKTSLLDDLFDRGTGAPVLRHLCVRKRALSWTSPLLTRLVSLEMTTGHDMSFPLNASTFHEVLDALERMRLLERIHLDVPLRVAESRALDAAVVTGATPPRVVAVANTLRTFIYEGLIVNARILLAHITLPPYASLQFEFIQFRHSGRTSDVAGILAAAFAHAASAPKTIFALTIVENFKDDGGVWVGAESREDVPGQPAIGMKFAYGGDIERDPWIGWGILPSALKACPLEHLEVLHVAAESEPAWRDSLGHAPALQVVVVKGTPAATTLCAALYPDDAANSSSNTLCFMPALAELCISDVDFTVDDGALADELALCLAVRGRAGHALRVLAVEKCIVSEAVARRLKNAVPGVVVVH
ncbi:hypothetical protein FA95DRAFT_107632 [Auriscalpium vulgare]|uniref:Uncharacterized protein n=1 Tax=Auriscalpium vulgare TaxID=40419 RepID=A0ACB8S6Y1_9AGAM|nr:hypothetical protein FA95DRAFT_107632 [Auriscalpium vulgare]